MVDVFLSTIVAGIPATKKDSTVDVVSTDGCSVKLELDTFDMVL